MIFTLQVKAPPCSSASAIAALRFAQAVVASEHTLTRVFFAGDGVVIGNSLIVAQQDETDLRREWQQIAQSCGTELILCISACLKRGIADDIMRARYDLPCANLAEHFQIAGLGLLAEAAIECDRLISFG